jgi:hypothetical protein
MYAISTAPGSCKPGMNGYVTSGNFKGLTTNDQATLLKNKKYTATTTDTYYLYIWLDAAETNSNTMDKSFDFSLGGECTDDPEILTLSKDTMAYDILINNPVPVAGATTGLFKSIDDLGTSYYYSGNVSNNYVQFGTYATNGPVFGYHINDSSDYREFTTLEECNSSSHYNVNCRYLYEENDLMYWRIVRINGNGTLRLVYDGPEKVANGTNHNATIGSAVHSRDDFHNVYFIGSGLQEELDLWYNTHLKTNYDGYVADEIFCEDSEVVHTDYWAWDEDESGYFIKITSDNAKDYDDFVCDYYYAPYERVLSRKSLPQLTCTRKEDRYTVDDVTNGNGLLNHPVGLLTADEVAFAGGTYNISNNTQYLYSGESFWTISPAYDAWYTGEDMATFVSIAVLKNGYLDVTYNCVRCEDGVRPVINLRAGVEFTGDGSFENPYVIKTN